MTGRERFLTALDNEKPDRLPCQVHSWMRCYLDTCLGVVDGNRLWWETITTPKGTLVQAGAANRFTPWTTEYLIKTERDFEIWNRCVPLPVRVGWGPVREARRRAGRVELDLVETGGGAGSSTVISPEMFRRFCLPYDQRQHEALHAAGTRVSASSRRQLPAPPRPVTNNCFGSVS